ncbi:hypothetical protein T484DRAFT_1876904, partial [Baffinella frigidus]
MAPKVHREDRGTLLEALDSIRADVEKLESDKKLTGTSAASGNEHLGPPSAPLPAGGLRELERVYRYVSIEEMEVDSIHRGRYTVVRQLARPVKLAGISTVVEDLDGTATMVEISDLLVSSRPISDVTFAVPIETIMLILDPFLKSNQTKTDVPGTALLRVDNPTHIIPLNLIPTDSLPSALRPRLATWLEERSAVPTGAIEAIGAIGAADPPGGGADKAAFAVGAEGNALYKQGKFARAAARYTRALELLPDDAVTLSSRAQCMVNTGEAGMAARDARRACALAPGNRRWRRRWRGCERGGGLPRASLLSWCDTGSQRGTHSGAG